jgi:hypothetical protein
LADNLAAVQGIIAAGIRATPKKPVTIDLQDRYGDQLAPAVKEIIKLGAVGCNIEAFDRGTNALWSVDEAAARVAPAKKVAARRGVPDFVVNARSDALFQEADAGMDSVIRRGKAYLAAAHDDGLSLGQRELGASSDSILTFQIIVRMPNGFEPRNAPTAGIKQGTNDRRNRIPSTPQPRHLQVAEPRSR